MTTDVMIFCPANAAADRFAAVVDRASDAGGGDDRSAEWAAELEIVATLRVAGPRLALGERGSKERIRERLFAALLADRADGLHVDIRARQTTRNTSLEAGTPVAVDAVRTH